MELRDPPCSERILGIIEHRISISSNGMGGQLYPWFPGSLEASVCRPRFWAMRQTSRGKPSLPDNGYRIQALALALPSLLSGCG